MNNKKQIIEILNKVASLSSSGLLQCKPVYMRYPLQFFYDYLETRKAIQHLHRLYPEQRLNNRQNLISQIAMAYAQLREAQKSQDYPMMHRFLSSHLYSQWRQQKSAFFNEQIVQQTLQFRSVSPSMQEKKILQTKNKFQQFQDSNQKRNSNAFLLHKSTNLGLAQIVTDLKIKKASVINSSNSLINQKQETQSNWFQCWIQVSHKHPQNGSKITKNHIVQRKLTNKKNSIRKWYFCHIDK